MHKQAVGFGLEYQCNFHSRLIYFKGYLPISFTQFLYSYSIIYKKGYTVSRRGSKLC